METIKFTITITNIIGIFTSLPIEIDVNKYDEMINYSKSFWLVDNSYILHSENKTHIFPKEIIAISIMTFNIIE